MGEQQGRNLRRRLPIHLLQALQVRSFSEDEDSRTEPAASAYLRGHHRRGREAKAEDLTRLQARAMRATGVTLPLEEDEGHGSPSGALEGDAKGGIHDAKWR